MNEIELCSGAIAGWHRPGDSRRVLALHGWLDNANSFCALAEHLPGVDLVAIDFPGHGHSRRRPEGVRYRFDDYVFDTLSVLDSLDWETCHLLGHSLGGAVASVAAAAAPDRFVTLSLIEGLGPLSQPAETSAGAWQKAVAASRWRPRRVHAGREAAIAARVEGSDLDPAAARKLAERGLIEREGGWQWRHDLRLTWPSEHRYTEGQVIDLLGAIRAHVFHIHSDPPSGILPPHFLPRRLAAVGSVRTMTCPGGHHLHMRHPGRIGPALLEHIDRHD